MPVTDMSDALNKIRHPDAATATGAAHFLLRVDSDEADDALWNYLWSPRYHPFVGQMILTSAPVWPTWYHQIILNHPDPRLKVSAARELFAQNLKKTEVESNPFFRAAEFEQEIDNYETAMTEEDQAQALAMFRKEPEYAKALKMTLLSHEFSNRTVPIRKDDPRYVMLLQILLKNVPSKDDATYALPALDKRYGASNIGNIASALLQGRSKVTNFRDDKEKKQFEDAGRNVLAFVGATASLNGNTESLQQVMNVVSSAEARLMMEFAKPSSGSRLSQDSWDRLAVTMAFKDKNWQEVARRMRSNPADYVQQAKEWLMLPDQSGDTVTQFLPMIYDMVDQGFLASLWESGSPEKRVAILSSVGERWPANILVQIAQEPDQRLASMAMQILAKRQQSHLLPSDVREPEL